MFLVERGELVAFDGGDYTATVRLAGSLATVVEAIPVSRAIDAAELTSGRRVAIAVFDAAHPEG